MIHNISLYYESIPSFKSVLSSYTIPINVYNIHIIYRYNRYIFFVSHSEFCFQNRSTGSFSKVPVLELLKPMREED